VDAFRFAKRAPRLVLFAPVIPGVEQAKQRETAEKQSKNGPSARRFRAQPVRHWDRWLHENADMADTHLIACDAEGGNRVDLTPGARREFAIEPALDVSADGKWVVATHQAIGKDRELDSTLWLIEIESGSSRHLGAADNVNFEAPRFSPDGRCIEGVRMTRSAKSAPRPLIAIIDVASGAMRQIGAQWDRWPGPACWSADGRRLYIAADDAGHTPVFAVDVATESVERITSIGCGGTHTDLVVLADGRVAGIRSTLLDAPECFVVAPEPDSTPKSLARLCLFAGAHEWAEVETLSVPSTDGTAIHSFLVKPKADAAKQFARMPLLLWIHGGPIGMDQDGWHWRWNPLLMVAQGYAVALPNPRGSTGFGQKFIQGIWGNVWGGQCYQDLMAVADALVARADIDAGRSMAMGGSFGGYMTNWIGTQTERFKCLITHASIATMAQFTGTADHPAWWYLEMGGENPYADMERFDRYAPIRQVRNWKTPVLIIHGERDYRCPINEGLNLFEALQYHGVDSELLVFPDENHWILKPRNIVAWYEAVLEFIDRHLRR
jgi:dipeptidyl aminopeptidase/acylaminoacyl peptidase